MVVDTSRICDAYFDLVDVMDPILKHYTPSNNFFGKVVTVKCFEQKGLIIDVLREVGEGRVLVIDAGGSLRSAVVDEETVALAQQNGWEAIVVYGAIRDVARLQKYDIPVMALGSIPVLAEDEHEGAIEVPVHFAGVSIYSDDYLYADSTGTLIASEQLDLGILE